MTTKKCSKQNNHWTWSESNFGDQRRNSMVNLNFGPVRSDQDEIRTCEGRTGRLGLISNSWFRRVTLNMSSNSKSTQNFGSDSGSPGCRHISVTMSERKSATNCYALHIFCTFYYVQYLKTLTFATPHHLPPPGACLLRKCSAWREILPTHTPSPTSHTHTHTPWARNISGRIITSVKERRQRRGEMDL